MGEGHDAPAGQQQRAGALMIAAESPQALAVIGPSIDFDRQERIRDRHVHPIATIRQGPAGIPQRS